MGTAVGISIRSRAWLTLLVVSGLWLFTAASAHATSLPSTITGNTTLTVAGSPYTGSSTIEPGVTVKVEPGVKFTINSLTVKGTLLAEGTAEAPIVFTGAKREKPGEWNHVFLSPGSGASVFNHTEFSYGSGGSGQAMLFVSGCSPTIENSTFSHSIQDGIFVGSGGGPEIANNHFSANEGRAIYFTDASSSGGKVNIHGNVVEGGTNGILAVANNAATVTTTMGGNAVSGTTGVAFSFEGASIPGDITGNALVGNSQDIIWVQGKVSHTETWNNGGTQVRFSGTVNVMAGATLTITSGVFITNPNFTINGALRAEGTANRPVVLTGPGEAQAGEWNRINLEAGSGSSIFNFVEMAYGGSGGVMLNIRGVSPTITNSTFRRSGGDAIRVQQSGHPTIEENRFRNNQFGLRYEGEGKLSAPRNDWGCHNGPKPTGCGDEVTSNVEWHPATTLQELPRLCPGATMLASSSPCLLQKYEPKLRYDSLENFYADSAAEITDNWGDEASFEGQGTEGPYSNALVDADQEAPVEEEREGLKLAESAPGVGKYQLTLAALGSSYPDGQVADSNDWLEEGNEYVRDAHRLEAAGYMDFAYGRAFTDGSGKRWLEYWYWYYYNPKSFEGVGVHEGDWESVLVGLDANNRPEEVILSQHTGGANCYIGEVEQTEEGGPVVYVAVDSHANYPKPGSFDAGFVTDYANGNGPAVQPALVILGDSPPSWLSWPGHWGYTRSGGVLGYADSPDGPSFHGAWTEPAEYAAGASECNRTIEEEFGGSPSLRSATTSTASIEHVDVKGQRPLVSYHVPGADGKGFWPRLRIAVNELGDGGIPPTSKTISNVMAKGRLAIPVEVKAGHAAEVLGSIVYKDGERIELAPKIVRSGIHRRGPCLSCQ